MSDIKTWQERQIEWPSLRALGLMEDEISDLRYALAASEARVEKLKVALVAAAIPLEVLATVEKIEPRDYLSDSLKTEINNGVEAIRAALEE